MCFSVIFLDKHISLKYILQQINMKIIQITPVSD